MISGTLTRLKETTHLVVLTGAGISAESGIPTFRDAMTGLWKNYSPEKLSSAKGFSQDPALAWGWYEWRRHKALRAEPNAGHQTIAKLATKLPKVTLITQNVDDLHERAGSQNVLHLHGSIHTARCFECRHPYEHPETSAIVKFPESRIEPPKCEKCGNWVRPNVVWFRELLPAKALREAELAVKECDLMLIVGTSGFVYPVANLPLLAIERNITTIQVNLTETDLDTKVTFDLKGKAGVILPELYKMAFEE
ncbi:MAG: NAD-dependent deacylase [Methylococcales bacterium]|nr:NAD-dependent deacylase [Methylococcales bacterium]MDD5753909.1 NAD-dependent deacylase [Methylococcales bacterium]